ncbi:PEP-CTERM sorting domain-containing protein [Nitrosospira sp. Nsp13]|uniref:PEP-CTERM sorting domain-containing protein n=1 Tax=Nitrosospira sp. Nsp13 TaxID=1855332 RepID=UPI00088E1E58|nr:PEP-CTERM sorting domain-containing protein [Nitrosospira sp. Nsp13]SCY34066.1 PEP-CTERM protein-sorting domain-containing protein [Nitrosospira sp. Nsp13]
MNKNFLSFCLAAVLGISSAMLHALPFADSVISFNGGAGFGIDDGIIDGEGIDDLQAVTAAIKALDGTIVALGGATGTPGTITMRFSSGEVLDGAGPDLRFYDTFSFLDGFSLDISANGSSFIHAFSLAGDLLNFSCSPAFPCITNVDISGTGLSEISYLRLTASGNSGQGFPEAYTLDAVEALNFRSSAVVPEPGILALIGLAATALVAIRRRKY